MRSLEDYPLEELKLVYRVLHRNLQEELELMDSELMQDLQGHLQQKAREAGVDISIHAQWATWLNGGVTLRSV
jgi:hypothetical protein